MDDKGMSYVDKMKRYINRRGITQREFAKRSGLSLSAVGHILTYSKKVQPWDAEKLDMLFRNDCMFSEDNK